MLNTRLFINKQNGEKIDATYFIGSITWGESIDDISTQLDFTIGLDNSYVKLSSDIEVGDIVNFFGDDLIFYGIIIDKSINGVHEQAFSCFDFGFYLNKNKLVKQFNSVDASTAIKSLCKEFGIGLNSPILTTKIDKLYYQNSISEIIGDILKKVKAETGVTYYYEVFGRSLEIFKRGAKRIAPKWTETQGASEISALSAIGSNFKKGYNIGEMKNSVQYFNLERQGVLVSKEDKPSIAKYGLLQEVIATDETDINKLNNYAENALKELNKVAETFTLQLIGDEKVRSGRSLNIKNETVKADGNYFITSCTHSILDGVHLMTLHLERE